METEAKIETIYLIQTDGKSFRFGLMDFCVVNVTPDQHGNVHGFIYFHCPVDGMAQSVPDEK